MYASVRRYRVDPGQADELLHRIDAEFLPGLEQRDGFVAYQVVYDDQDRLTTITTFFDQQAAADSALLAAEWIRDNLQDYDIERLDVVNGEVAVSRAGSALLEPAHH